MLGITATQSYGWVIRNVFFDALKADSFFVGYHCRKTPMEVVQFEHLPYLGVYIVDETMLPDGDANAHAPSFIHTLKIGFSVIIANNDMDVAEAMIDAAFWRIMNRLWTDAGIMNVYYSTNPDNTLIEALTRGTRRPVFGREQRDQQTPVAEVRYEISVTFRTDWPPVIPDDFLVIDLKTGIKPGDSPDEMAKRQQIHTIYDMRLPIVESIAPNTGPIAGGTSVIITGTGFYGALGVKFGDDAALMTLDSPTQITAISPPADAAGVVVDVIVTNTLGASLAHDDDEFTYA
jgi:IPT/TIG domain